MKKWKTYKPDQKLTTAGLTILEIKNFGRNQMSTLYDVRFHCCGAVGRMAHDVIRKRESREPKGCMYCKNSKAGNSAPSSITTIPIDTKKWPALRELPVEQKTICEQEHKWEMKNHRPCPCSPLDVSCSQPVFECSVCGEIDYGRENGPGLRHCIKEDVQGRCPIHIVSCIRRNNEHEAYTSQSPKPWK